MKEKIKKLVNKNPFLKDIIDEMREKKKRFSSKFDKNIIGKENSLKIDPTAIFNNCVIDIDGNNNTVIVDKNCQLNNLKIHIQGNDNLLVLNESVKFNGLFWLTGNKGKIEIGAGTTTEYNVMLQISEDNLSIQVGEDCMFSSNILVWTQDWHHIYDLEGNLINESKSVIIKDHVWIGYDSKILKGVTIGSNNIIGAGAVVTKSYEEENVVIAGNPGRIVKRDITWKR